MVSFWDTSAVIPLAVAEPATARLQPLLDVDPGMVVWWGTRVEFVSAVARRLREDATAKETVRDARRVLAALAKEWTEVAPTEGAQIHQCARTVHYWFAADDNSARRGRIDQPYSGEKGGFARATRAKQRH